MKTTIAFVLFVLVGFGAQASAQELTDSISSESARINFRASIADMVAIFEFAPQSSRGLPICELGGPTAMDKNRQLGEGEVWVITDRPLVVNLRFKPTKEHPQSVGECVLPMGSKVAAKDGILQWVAACGNDEVNRNIRVGPIPLLKGDKGDSVKGDKGDPGLKGNDGHTPVKGVDYFDGKNGTNGKNGFCSSKKCKWTLATVIAAGTGAGGYLIWDNSRRNQSSATATATVVIKLGVR